MAASSYIVECIVNSNVHLRSMWTRTFPSQGQVDPPLFSYVDGCRRTVSGQTRISSIFDAAHEWTGSCANPQIHDERRALDSVYKLCRRAGVCRYCRRRRQRASKTSPIEALATQIESLLHVASRISIKLSSSPNQIRAAAYRFPRLLRCWQILVRRRWPELFSRQ